MDYAVSFILICIAQAFEHEQARHAKKFQGSSQSFCTALWISALSCKGLSLGLLIFIGVRHSWIAAIAMLVGGVVLPGFIAGILSGALNRQFGPTSQSYISIAAFIVWPTSLIAAFILLPK